MFALVLAADPGLLAALLYWTALTMAVLLPRTARFDDGWRWLQRLVLHGLIAPFGLFRDRMHRAPGAPPPRADRHWRGKPRS